MTYPLSPCELILTGCPVLSVAPGCDTYLKSFRSAFGEYSSLLTSLPSYSTRRNETNSSQGCLASPMHQYLVWWALSTPADKYSRSAQKVKRYPDVAHHKVHSATSPKRLPARQQQHGIIRVLLRISCKTPIVFRVTNASTEIARKV